MRKNSKAPAAKERQAEVRRILDLLHRWGIDTLGQFAALEKEAVGARLGAIGLELWERARGKTTRLLKLVTTPESFEESFEFENEIETSEPLLFMLRRFLQQFSVRLGALYLVIRELELLITFTDKRTYQHRFKIPEPTNNIEVLFRMLHTHLENFTSDSPILAVALKAEPAKPSFEQFHLFETALRDPMRLTETLARLSGLLGPDRVGTPVLEETHRPDAFRMEPFAWQLPEEKADDLPPLPAAALRRFRSPLPASVLLAKNRPVHFRSPKTQGAVRAEKGPYLASGNWWDGKAWGRAEWDVELETGAVCQCHSSAGQWALDGIYD
ncbi:MAG: protein ImuB [Verrucomicrobiota bacterium]